MGLSGSGKTTLAKELADLLVCAHINADEVRKKT
jgi:predicted kinase